MSAYTCTFKGLEMGDFDIILFRDCETRKDTVLLFLVIS